MFIIGSQPYASEEKINSLVKHKVSSFISITEAGHIVSYLYSKHDSESIFAKLKEKEEPLLDSLPERYSIKPCI